MHGGAQVLPAGARGASRAAAAKAAARTGTIATTKHLQAHKWDLFLEVATMSKEAMTTADTMAKRVLLWQH